MKKRADELIGAELDYAVAKAFGHTDDDAEMITTPGKFNQAHYSPSTNWAQGGLIIEREQLWLQPSFNGQWYSHKTGLGSSKCPQYGPTPLIAAMRAFVASRLGNEIEIPGDGNDT